MGMSASQVRLLTITKRIHEVENEAERIQNQKMLLGLQSDEAYEEYLHAMETKNIEYSWFNPNSGNFDWSELKLSNLFDNDRFRLKVKNLGDIIVQNGKKYVKVPGQTVTSDPETVSVQTSLTTTHHTVTIDHCDINGSTYEYCDANNNVIASSAGPLSTGDVVTVTDNGHQFRGVYNGTDIDYDENVYSITDGDGNSQTFTEYADMNNFTYSTGTNPTKNYTFDIASCSLSRVTVTTNAPTTSTYEIDKDGWVMCKSAEEVAAALGTTTLNFDDPIVLRDIIYNAYGIVMAEIFDEDTQQPKWKETSVATNTGLREMTDKDQLAIAEANYEAAMRKIDKKEQQYDKDLAKMDQERKALTTQLDTLKTCIKDNIDRTFKIFQG